MASEIGVQTIQHTNGTDAMTIDSSGRVTLGNPIAFFANSGGSNTAAGATITSWNVVVNSGSAFSASTGRFTAPVAGIYVFNVTLLGNPHSGSTNEVRLRLNGTDYMKLRDDTQNGRYQTFGGGVVVNMNANDYVSLYNNSSTLGGHNNEWHHFSGYLLG